MGVWWIDNRLGDRGITPLVVERVDYGGLGTEKGPHNFFNLIGLLKT